MIRLRQLDKVLPPSYQHHPYSPEAYQLAMFRLSAILIKTDKGMEEEAYADYYYQITHDFFASKGQKNEKPIWQSDLTSRSMFLSLGNEKVLVFVIPPSERQNMISRKNYNKPIIDIANKVLFRLPGNDEPSTKVIITNIYEWYIFDSTQSQKIDTDSAIHFQLYGLQAQIQSGSQEVLRQIILIDKTLSLPFLLGQSDRINIKSNLNIFLKELQNRLDGYLIDRKASSVEVIVILNELLMYISKGGLYNNESTESLKRDHSLIEKQLSTSIGKVSKSRRKIKLRKLINSLLAEWKIYFRPTIHVSMDADRELSVYQFFKVLEFVCENYVEVSVRGGGKSNLNFKHIFQSWFDKENFGNGNEGSALPRCAYLTPGIGSSLRECLEALLEAQSKYQLLYDSDPNSPSFTVEFNNEWISFKEEGGMFCGEASRKELVVVLRERLEEYLENCLWLIESNPIRYSFLAAHYLLFQLVLEKPIEDVILGNLFFANPLLNQFPIEGDLEKELIGTPFTVGDYLYALENAKASNKKEAALKELQRIKACFLSFQSQFDRRKNRLNKLQEKFFREFQSPLLWQENGKGSGQAGIEILKEQISELRKELEEDMSGKNFELAFEWRFDIPQLLDEKGKWLGFDLVFGESISNYFCEKGLSRTYLKRSFQTYSYHFPIHRYLPERIMHLLGEKGLGYFLLKRSDWESQLGKMLKDRMRQMNIEWEITTPESPQYNYLTISLCKNKTIPKEFEMVQV